MRFISHPRKLGLANEDYLKASCVTINSTSFVLLGFFSGKTTAFVSEVCLI